MNRRVLALGLSLAALLGVVAAAAAVGVEDRAASGGGSASDAVGAATAAGAIVAALVAIPVVAFFAIRELPERRRRSRRSWATPLAIVALAGIGVAIASVDPSALADALARVRLADAPSGGTPAPAPPDAPWLPLLLAAALALGGGALALRRRPAAPSRAATLVDALAAPLDDLRREPDVRRAIVAAFARLEAALDAAGTPRRPGEAPLEFVERVLGTLAVPPGPTAALADAFEVAKFSRHPLGEADREAAIAALEDVREALR